MYDKLIKIMNEVRPDIDYEEVDNLISGEILDSFDIVVIVGEILEQLGIEIPVEEINEDGFDSVMKIEELLVKLSSQ